MFAILSSTRATLSDLATSRAVDRLSGDECVSALRELGAIRRIVDVLCSDACARIDAERAYRGRGDRSTYETASKALRSSRGAAADLLAAAQAAKQDDRLDAAQRRGELDARSTAMIGATAARAPDSVPGLLDAAQSGPRALREACARARAEAEDTAERARRHHAARELHVDTDDDGMVRGRFRLAPEIGSQIKALIDTGVQRRFRANRSGAHEPHHAYAADELTELVLAHAPSNGEAPENSDIPESGDADNDVRGAQTEGSAGGMSPNPTDLLGTGPPERECTCTNRSARRASHKRSRVAATVHVVIDHAVLIRGNAFTGERCEIPGVGPVNTQWVLDLLGDAFLTAIIKDGTDIKTVSHFGRHINAKLRTALMVQGRECDIEGCGARGYLEIDHAHEHAKRGPTSLSNLGWLCSHHHRLKTTGWHVGPRDPVTGKRRLTPPARAPATPSRP